jgi:hypothetical protein
MYLMGGWYGSEMSGGQDHNGIMIPGYETEMVGRGHIRMYIYICTYICIYIHTHT